MSNRRKIKRPKNPKSQDQGKLPPEIITLKGKSTVIGNRIKAQINGFPDPNLHYPAIMVFDEGHLLDSDVKLTITYMNERTVPRAPEQTEARRIDL